VLLTAVVLSLPGCGKPEPLSALVQRVDDGVGQRLDAPVHVACLLADPAPSIEQPPPVLTLPDARRLALKQNLALSAAAESLPIAQLALVQAGLLTNPVLGQSNGLLFPVVPVTGGAALFDANITQQLNSIFTRDARVAIAGVQRLQAGIDLAAVAFDLGMKVEGKYRELVTLNGSLSIAERTEATYAVASQSADVRSRVGVLPISEVNRAKVAAEDARRQVAKLRLRRAQSVRDLNFLMGVPADSAWSIAHDPPGAGSDHPPDASGIDDEAARVLAARFRLDVVRARFDERAAEESVRLAKAGMIPNITAGVEGVYTPGHPSSTVLGPVVSIELPIFDSHRTQLESAKANLRRVHKTTASLEVQASADASAAVHALALVQSDVSFYRDRILPQHRENVRLAQTSFQIGQIDLDSLLNTLRDATAAEQAAQDAQAAFDDAQVALERAMGVSTERAREALINPDAGDPWSEPAPQTENP
jgi:outer membrane protein TolC